MTRAEKEVILSLRQQQYSFSGISETTGLPLGKTESCVWYVEILLAIQDFFILGRIKRFDTIGFHLFFSKYYVYIHITIYVLWELKYSLHW